MLFERPKPTAGCSANGRRRRRSERQIGKMQYKFMKLNEHSSKKAKEGRK
jgi:hypothetical protein